MRTTHRRIKQVTQLTGAMVRDVGESAIHLFPLPPYPNWFARGPRGGVYLAVGERTRSMAVDGYNFHQDLYVVLDESADSRYIRPGTALYREAILDDVPQT